MSTRHYSPSAPQPADAPRSRDDAAVPRTGDDLAARRQAANSTRSGGATAAIPDPAAARQACRILQFGFTVAPIVAGLDKFFHVLTDWDRYLAPSVANLLGGLAGPFMLAVGAIEIAAGIGVALRPRIFAYVVSAWLLGIVVNLLMIPGYFDIALRDFGLSLGAFALARLSRRHPR